MQVLAQVRAERDRMGPLEAVGIRVCRINADQARSRPPVLVPLGPVPRREGQGVKGRNVNPTHPPRLQKRKRARKVRVSGMVLRARVEEVLYPVQA